MTPEQLFSRAVRWAVLRERGMKMREIARREGVSQRTIQFWVARVKVLEDEMQLERSRLEREHIDGIKLPRDHEPPRTLEPLTLMGGIPYREDVCPKHPGLFLAEPNALAQRLNPEFRRWRGSNFCCCSCFRSPRDASLRLDPKDIPPRITLPPKEPPTETRREKRRKKFAGVLDTKTFDEKVTA